jgi:hypothetical protein
MAKMSRLGWLIGPPVKCGQIPCISCMWCLVQSATPSPLSNIFCSLLHMHVGLILIFQADPVSGYICAFIVYLFHHCNICQSHGILFSMCLDFSGIPLNIRDNNSALVYCIWRIIASRRLHYRVSEFLWVFIKHQMVFSCSQFCCRNSSGPDKWPWLDWQNYEWLPFLCDWT